VEGVQAARSGALLQLHPKKSPPGLATRGAISPRAPMAAPSSAALPLQPWDAARHASGSTGSPKEGPPALPWPPTQKPRAAPGH